MWRALHAYFFFFFNDTATTEIYTLSLHDALPISEHRHIVVLPQRLHRAVGGVVVQKGYVLGAQSEVVLDKRLHVRSAVPDEADDDELVFPVRYLLGTVQVL